MQSKKIMVNAQMLAKNNHKAQAAANVETEIQKHK